MRCPECDSENMEGSDRCWSCDAALKERKDTAPTHGGWLLWAVAAFVVVAVIVMLMSSGTGPGGGGGSPTVDAGSGTATGTVSASSTVPATPTPPGVAPGSGAPTRTP
jgi:hypothetical protein